MLKCWSREWKFKDDTNRQVTLCAQWKRECPAGNVYLVALRDGRDVCAWESELVSAEPPTFDDCVSAITVDLWRIINGASNRSETTVLIRECDTHPAECEICGKEVG